VGELGLFAASCRPAIRKLKNHGSAVIRDDYVAEVSSALPRERLAELNFLIADDTHPIANSGLGGRTCAAARPSDEPLLPE
jgi:hypothetical protein